MDEGGRAACPVLALESGLYSGWLGGPSRHALTAVIQGLSTGALGGAIGGPTLGIIGRCSPGRNGPCMGLGAVAGCELRHVLSAASSGSVAGPCTGALLVGATFARHCAANCCARCASLSTGGGASSSSSQENGFHQGISYPQFTITVRVKVL